MRVLNYLLLLLPLLVSAKSNLIPYDDLFKDHPATTAEKKSVQKEAQNDPARAKIEAYRKKHSSLEGSSLDIKDPEDEIKLQHLYQHDVALMFAIHYQPETVNDYTFNFSPWLNYRFYLNGEKSIVFKSSIFIDTLIKLSFSNEADYGDFYQQDETYFQGHLGGGWRHYLKNYAFSYFGGLKVHLESFTRSFKDSNASGDYGYGEKSHFLMDYGLYLGADAGLIFSKTSLSNLFMLKGFLIYDYYVRLDEHRFYTGLSLNYLF